MDKRVWDEWMPRLVALASFVLLAPVVAHAGQPAAVVVDYDGAASVVGERFGKPIELQLGSVLEEGDRLDVPRAGFVKLNSAGECQLLLSPEATVAEETGCSASRVSSYSVPASGLTGGVSSRYQQLAEVLGWWDPERKSKPMRSRESYALRVPALDKVAKPSVVAGSRTFEVRWVDGKPPFRLNAILPDGNQIDGTVADGARNGTISAHIEAGKAFRLVVTDATRTVSYKVYGASGFADDNDSPPLDDFDRASRIVAAISESGGDWAFEGVQQIRGLTLDRRVKQALTNAIEYGDWP